jgi:hypothetical protein
MSVENEEKNEENNEEDYNPCLVEIACQGACCINNTISMSPEEYKIYIGGTIPNVDNVSVGDEKKWVGVRWVNTYEEFYEEFEVIANNHDARDQPAGLYVFFDEPGNIYHVRNHQRYCPNYIRNQGCGIRGSAPTGCKKFKFKGSGCGIARESEPFLTGEGAVSSEIYAAHETHIRTGNAMQRQLQTQRTSGLIMPFDIPEA